MRERPIWRRYMQLLRSNSAADVDEELAFHVARRVEDLVAQGLSEAEARDRATKEFGSVERVRRELQAIGRRRRQRARRAHWWESLTQDLRFALRMLRKMPGFTAVTVFSLTLGIGLNSSVFSVVSALLLRPLPSPEPERLVRIFQHAHGNTSYRNYRDLQARSATLDSLAAFSWPNPVALTIPAGEGAGQTEQVWSAAVSVNYFDVLGVQAQLGRTFLLEEDAVPGETPVAVISDQLWRASFDADPHVIGRVVRINGHPFEVIGVAAPDVPQPDTLFTHEVWVPVTMCGQVGIGDRLEDRRNSWLRMIGRRKPETTLPQLQAEADVIADQIEAANPESARNLSFAPYHETEARLAGLPGARQFGWILQAVVLLVLAIACANIANLQLARSLARTKEIAIRMAIGSGRGRIIRQFVIESLLLTLLGGALGLLSAFWGGRILLSLAPPTPIPAALDVAPDWRVLTSGLAACLVVGVLFGTVTALSTAQFGLNPLLKSGDLSVRPGRTWLSPRKLLVAGQVGLSVVLLVAAGLFLESLANARRMDLGFQPENRLTVSVNAGMQGYREEQGRALHEEALRRLAELPGVVSVSSTATLPLSGGYLGDGWIWPEGDADPSEAGRPMVYFDRVGPGYFQTMGAALLRGRDFTERDRKDSPQVAVVNETFAQRFWPGEDAIGKRFRTGGVNGPLIEIVGVVRDGKYNSLGETPQRHVYQPFSQGYAHFFTFVLHAGADPRGIAGAVRATMRKVDPAVPITSIKTMAEHLGYAFWGAETGAALIGIFALLGLLLSAVGLYGTLTFVVNRSIPEIGVRMALGASPNRVQRLYIRRGLMLALAGAVPGILAAIAATRLLTSYLYGVNPLSPVTLASVAALLLSVAFVACYLPARRAVKIEPLHALRHE
jgi:predicted permease